MLKLVDKKEKQIYELPLASASGLKIEQQIGFSQIYVYFFYPPSKAEGNSITMKIKEI